MTDKITSIANLCADRIADRIEMHQLAKKPILKSDIAEDVARVLRELGIETAPSTPVPTIPHQQLPYFEPSPYVHVPTRVSNGTGPMIGGSMAVERVWYDDVNQCVKTIEISADELIADDEEAEYWRQLNSIMTANELKRYRALLKPRSE